MLSRVFRSLSLSLGQAAYRMDSFSGATSGGATPQMSTEDFMDQLKTQLAQAYAEEFLEVT